MKEKEFMKRPVYCFAANLQLLLRGFEQIGECTALVFIKASAAGIAGILCIVTIDDNFALAAAIIRIMHTAGNITI